MTNAITETMGCDLGDKYSHLCVLDAQGQVRDRARIRTTQAGFRKWFAGRGAGTVVLEVGTHSRWVQGTLVELGHEVIVANARQVGLIYGSTRKNDRLDAERLARLGRFDRQLLSPIEHRGDRAHSQLMVLRSRDQLVKVRTELINHVRGVCKSLGIRIRKGDSCSFAGRARQAIPPSSAPALAPLLDVLEQLNAQIKAFDARIEKMAEDDPKVQALRTIRGVGALTAMAFTLTLEDPERFARSRDVGAFLGLVPRERQTGQSDPELRISKAGDSFVRRLLVNCAHHILGPHGVDSDLRRYGQRLQQRGGKNAKKKAVIAVARKLAVLMHRLWVTGEIYQPLHAQNSAVVVT